MARSGEGETPEEVHPRKLARYSTSLDIGRGEISAPPVGELYHRIYREGYDVMVIVNENSKLMEHGYIGKQLINVDMLLGDFNINGLNDASTAEMQSYLKFLITMKQAGIDAVLYGGVASFDKGLGPYLWDISDEITAANFPGSAVFVSDKSDGGWSSWQVEQRVAAGKIKVIWQDIMNGTPAYVYQVL
jgi:hypothetical protein